MLDTDPDQFDCETCPLADQMSALDAENAEAWRVFGRLYTRLHVDWRLIPAMFERVVVGMDDEDVLSLTERLAVIYDVLCPPQIQQPD